MEPLTIDQLKSLGFHIFYKNKKGEQVFDCATHPDWETDNLIGNLHKLPTFEELVRTIAENATEKEKSRIAEKWRKEMLD